MHLRYLLLFFGGILLQLLWACTDGPLPPKYHGVQATKGTFGYITLMGKHCLGNRCCLVLVKIKNNGNKPDTLNWANLYNPEHTFTLLNTKGEEVVDAPKEFPTVDEQNVNAIELLQPGDSVIYHISINPLHANVPHGPYSLRMRNLPSNTVIVHLSDKEAPVWAKEKGDKSDNYPISIDKPLRFVPWGTVEQGVKLSYSFELKNTLQDTLVFRRISTGENGCFALKGGAGDGETISYEQIPPGATFPMVIEKYTKDIKGVQQNLIQMYFTKTSTDSLWGRSFLFYGFVQIPSDTALN